MTIGLIKLISTEYIKPSSPTPSHLQDYRLSFLDQIAPPVFMPIVLFYPFSDRQTSRHLKTTLSAALSLFYPLAGRLADDNLSINCNDAGVPYVEARCFSTLADVITDPNPNDLNTFFPYALDDVRDLPAVIQATFFDGGGLAVAIALSHKAGDALSFFMFVNSWSAISRGDPAGVVSPEFGSAELFPPQDIKGFKLITGIVKDKIITKRFVFSADKIRDLREKYADKVPAGHRRPSRVEALSAFIWSRFVAATEMKAESDKFYTILHAVNLRPRTEPPLPENYFGNISRVAIAVPSMEDDGDRRGGIILKMRKAISGIDGDFVKKLGESGGKHLNSLKDRSEKAIKGELVTLNFTSLCRFPIYEADFGWGKPAWAGSARMVFKNLIVFLDTNWGDGIEAWMNLTEEDMAKVELDKELISYVSHTPISFQI